MCFFEKAGKDRAVEVKSFAQGPNSDPTHPGIWTSNFPIMGTAPYSAGPHTANQR